MSHVSCKTCSHLDPGNLIVFPGSYWHDKFHNNRQVSVLYNNRKRSDFKPPILSKLVKNNWQPHEWSGHFWLKLSKWNHEASICGGSNWSLCCSYLKDKLIFQEEREQNNCTYFWGFFHSIEMKSLCSTRNVFDAEVLYSCLQKSHITPPPPSPSNWLTTNSKGIVVMPSIWERSGSKQNIGSEAWNPFSTLAYTGWNHSSAGRSITFSWTFGMDTKNTHSMLQIGVNLGSAAYHLILQRWHSPLPTTLPPSHRHKLVI